VGARFGVSHVPSTLAEREGATGRKTNPLGTHPIPRRPGGDYRDVSVPSSAGSVAASSAARAVHDNRRPGLRWPDHGVHRSRDSAATRVG